MTTLSKINLNLVDTQGLPISIFGNSQVDADYSTLFKLDAEWKGTNVARIEFTTGSSSLLSEDDGEIIFLTKQSGQSLTKSMTIDKTGNTNIHNAKLWLNNIKIIDKDNIDSTLKILNEINWNTLIQTFGTGNLSIKTEGVAELIFGTNNLDRLRITSLGDVNVLTGDLIISASGKGIVPNGGNLPITGTVSPTDNIIMPTGKGIDFSATTDGSGVTTSELFDDYEEGTWTPIVSTGFTTPTYDTALTKGFYTKVGGVVHLHGRVALTGGTSVGATLKLGGLPFSVSALTGYTASGAVNINVCGALGTVTWLGCLVVASNDFIFIRTNYNNGTAGGNLFGTTATNLVDLSFSISYKTV